MSIDQLPLTSGAIKGSTDDWIPILMKDAEAISGLFSGRFFTFDSDGLGVICISTSQTISGWIESGTVASTSSTKRPGIVAPTPVVFRLPVTGAALTQTHIGQFCDLAVSGGIQYAAIGTSSHDLLRIVGGLFGSSAALSYADVMINSDELYEAT